MEPSEEIAAPQNRHERRAAAAEERRGRKFVRYRDLQPRYGITWSRMHVDREEKAGRFPKRVHYGVNSVAWIEDEILDWQGARIAARETPPPRDQPEAPRAA